MYSYYFSIGKVSDEGTTRGAIMRGVVPKSGDVRITSLLEGLEQAAMLTSQVNPEIDPREALRMIIQALAVDWRENFGDD